VNVSISDASNIKKGLNLFGKRPESDMCSLDDLKENLQTCQILKEIKR